LFAAGLTGKGEAPTGFILAIALWLWFTVLFANFAEALAEGRSKAQAASLRGLKKRDWAKRLEGTAARREMALSRGTRGSDCASGDVVLVDAGDTIPGRRRGHRRRASVDESAITGESAPVIRESGGDFSAVTGGTRVLSDWIVVRVTVNPGETFRRPDDRDGRERQAAKDAERDRADHPAGALTIVFLLASPSRCCRSRIFSVAAAGAGSPVSITVLVALLVCLIPTTIGGLLSAIGVAGMSRMMQANVIATSGRAVEAAGDVDVLLLDKTGTITLGNRQAAFLPARA
jgi:K+-transporting ATPase ATPase B chain